VAVAILQGCLPRVEVKKRSGIMKKESESGKKTMTGLKPRRDLHWAEMMNRGGYEQFMNEAEKVFRDTDSYEQKQRALYYMALTLIYPNNPSRDMKRAARYFRELIQLYPDSLYAEESRVWLGLISIIEKSKKIDIEIEKKKQEFSK